MAAAQSAIVYFPFSILAVKVESVGNAPTSACLQSKCIACLPRPRINLRFAILDLRFGRLPPCCPE